VSCIKLLDGSNSIDILAGIAKHGILLYPRLAPVRAAIEQQGPMPIHGVHDQYACRDGVTSNTNGTDVILPKSWYSCWMPSNPLREYRAAKQPGQEDDVDNAVLHYVVY
jgi:hypothetical protein